MTTRIKWIYAIFIALFAFSLFGLIVTIAQAGNILYLPQVYKQLPPTPTPTPTPGPDVEITDLDVGDSLTDIDSEVVTLENQTDDDIDMTDWVLHDYYEDEVFTFPDFTLDEDDFVRVWSGSGTDDDNDLYWDSDEPVWNQGSDCVFLLDEDEEEVDRFCYGD